MIDRTHALPVKRQAELVGISRGTVYYHPEPMSDADLRLMRRIDELRLELPFAGSCMLRDLLRGEGFDAGRRHAATLVRRIGIESRRCTASPIRARRAPQAPGVPVPAAWAGHRAGQPGLGDGHQCAMQARFATTEKGARQRQRTKLADSRPAAETLPRTGGGRAKGGCKARPFADGWVSCAEQPELYRAWSRSGCESGYRKVYGETTKRALEASVLTAPPCPSGGVMWRDPVGLDVPFWRVRNAALDDGFPPSAIVRSHQG